jgi:hypothetical protein
MHRMVDVAPGATATHPHRARPWIDMNVLDGRKVDDQAVIAYSQTAGIMAAAANGNPQIVFPAEMNCGHHIGHICTLGNQTRFSIDHGVIHSAFFFVSLVGGLYQVTPQLTFKFTDILLLHIFLSFVANQSVQAASIDAPCPAGKDWWHRAYSSGDNAASIAHQQIIDCGNECSAHFGVLLFSKLVMILFSCV